MRKILSFAVLTSLLITTNLAFGVQTGGPLLSVSVQTGTTQFVSPSTTYVNVPGANVSATVPSGGALVHVTFSAECKLIGAGPFDWVEIRVLLNGSPMQPNDLASPTALCGADSYSLNSGQWTRRVSASGAANVRVQVRVVTNSGNTGEQFWVDDFNLKVEIYQ
jgi:hypothetical protein